MPKEIHKNYQQRRPLKPSIVVLNDNRILNDQLKYHSIKLTEKFDDVRLKGNDIVSQNACKKLNIPHQSNMYKDLIEIDCIDNEQKTNRTSSRRDKNAKVQQHDLEPEPINCSQLVKHEYLMNAFGTNDSIIDAKKDDTKSEKRKQKPKRFPSKSRLIAKIQEWNSLTE